MLFFNAESFLSVTSEGFFPYFFISKLEKEEIFVDDWMLSFPVVGKLLLATLIAHTEAVRILFSDFKLESWFS